MSRNDIVWSGRIEIVAPGRRLYVSDGSAGRAYILATTLQEARRVAPGAAPASTEQVRDLLRELRDKPTGEITRRLGVSRQTLHNWRRRTGTPLDPDNGRPRFGVDSILATIRGGASIAETARAAGCSESTVRRLARSASVKPEPRRTYPPDDKIVELANGKTWPELSEALGRDIKAARAWIYKRRELARALRAVMVRSAPKGKPVKC